MTKWEGREIQLFGFQILVHVCAYLCLCVHVCLNIPELRSSDLLLAESSPSPKDFNSSYDSDLTEQKK